MFAKPKKKEILMQALRNYKPTSKSSLKHFCLMVTDCNVAEAEKLYDFMIKDMDDLPTFDPQPATWVGNTKTTITELFSFFKEHQETLAQGYEFIQGLISKNKQVAAVKEVVETLPKIN